MRKLVLFAFVIASIVSCSKVKKGEFIITGTAKGMEDGKTVILQTQDEAGMAMVAVDTVKVKDGKFEFKGKIKEPTMYALSFPDYNNGFPVIVENDEIKVDVKKDSINISRISGTYNNDEFQKFNDEAKKIQKKMQAFQTKNMQAFTEAQQKNDTVTLNKLIKQNSVIQDELKNMMLKYPDTHPKSFISALIVLEMFRAPDADPKKIKKIYDNFDASIKSTKPAKKIKEQLDMFSKATPAPKPVAAVTVGQMAPDFSAKTPEGTTVSLKESLGKVTIIDFWASWCGPCRKENPAVVALYNELHTKGLNIVGVSLDKDAAKWKEAIAKDKLTWPQISNLLEWKDPIAMQYNIEQIPTTYLLDSTGKIVAKDLRGAELKAKVVELLSAS
ncbi:MAG: TlpA disulfide reductase family protein [Bacteroidota bacterium]